MYLFSFSWDWDWEKNVMNILASIIFSHKFNEIHSLLKEIIIVNKWKGVLISLAMSLS